MSTPQLWVWVGGQDGDLDPIRYVRATDDDILNQLMVLDEWVRLKTRTAKEWGRANKAEAHVAALRAFAASVESEAMRELGRMGSAGIAADLSRADRWAKLRDRARALLKETKP